MLTNGEDGLVNRLLDKQGGSSQLFRHTKLLQIIQLQAVLLQQNNNIACFCIQRIRRYTPGEHSAAISNNI